MVELPPTRKALVYGDVDDSVVFIDIEHATELANLHKALRSATWGELREAISRKRMQQVLDRVAGDVSPDDGDPFDAQTLSGYADGDWPEWPAQEMLDWMPREVVARYGTVEGTLLNGDFLKFERGFARAIAEFLEDKGWRCTEDDDLLRAASGW